MDAKELLLWSAHASSRARDASERADELRARTEQLQIDTEKLISEAKSRNDAQDTEAP